MDIPTFRGQPPPKRKTNEIGSTTYYAPPPRATSSLNNAYLVQPQISEQDQASEAQSYYYYDPNYYNYYASYYEGYNNNDKESNEQLHSANSTDNTLITSTPDTNNNVNEEHLQEETEQTESVELPKPKEPVFRPGYNGPYSAWTSVEKEDEILDKNQYEDIEAPEEQHQEAANEDESDRSDVELESHLKTKTADLSNDVDSENSQVNFKRKSVSTGTANRRKFRKKDTLQNED